MLLFKQTSERRLLLNGCHLKSIPAMDVEVARLRLVHGGFGPWPVDTAGGIQPVVVAGGILPGILTGLTETVFPHPHSDASELAGDSTTLRWLASVRFRQS